MIEALTATGTVHRVGPIETVKDKYRKRVLVLVFDGRYPQHVGFQLSGDKCAEADRINVGDRVAVTYDIRGREYQKDGEPVRNFVTLEAWRIEVVSSNRATATDYSQVKAAAPADTLSDDVPF